MIRVDQLGLKQGDFEISDISFEIPQGKYAILMGRTGSGKTTILEAICGLRPIRSGKVLLLDRDVTKLKTAERGVGYVPQDLALFPTMTVEEHLSFALRVRHWEKEHIEERVNAMAGLLGIRYLLHRKPHGLSGGESQRVALGRALSFHPEILLLDEPLSALDESTRDEMYDLLSMVQHRTGVTTLHITHSWSEALRLGDIVLSLEEGRVRELSSEELTLTRSGKEIASNGTSSSRPRSEPSTAIKPAE